MVKITTSNELLRRFVNSGYWPVEDQEFRGDDQRPENDPVNVSFKLVVQDLMPLLNNGINLSEAQYLAVEGMVYRFAGEDVVHRLRTPKERSYELFTVVDLFVIATYIHSCR